MAANSSSMPPFKNYDRQNLSLYRSGSEPPPVEGSLNSITELNSSGVGSNPDYLSYYYNSVTRNPRVPPPILSKEDWGSRQRLGHDVNHCSETQFLLNPNNSYHTSDLVDSDNLVAALRGLNLCNDVSDINAQQSFSRESRSLNPAHSYKSPFLVSSPSSRLFPDLIPTGNLSPLLENAVNASSCSSFASMSDPLYVECLKKLEYANLIEQSYVDKLWKMRQFSSQFYGNNGYNLNLAHPLKSVKCSDGLKEGFHSKLSKVFIKNMVKRDLALSDIAGYVVDFSVDKFGSRFVQRKLETASIQEINMVFEEIMPQALSLTTNMFGNFVIQKVFECGSSQQIRELTSMLYSNVLHLSLQMHGCYIIQKAIEVVDLDQKVKLAAELDGHIMGCVKDQNGNHVIQKCIECIPEEAIQFIISYFHDKIIALSTHKYGFRIVRRILEHCIDPNTHKIVIDEVMKHVRMLARNQYGNFVLQHVVEHGKPEERSAIIKQLTGKIVWMSRQKYASIVVEKCLTFGSLEEREMLVKEMIGNTCGNEPLQAMMKDRFGKYVVRKVLETCSDQQFQLVLSRMKAHLRAVKKDKHAKEAVSRAENLVPAAERRNAFQST